MLKWAK